MKAKPAGGTVYSNCFCAGALTGFLAEGLLAIMLLVDLIVLIYKPNP